MYCNRYKLIYDILRRLKALLLVSEILFGLSPAYLSYISVHRTTTDADWSVILKQKKKKDTTRIVVYWCHV